MPGDVGVSQWHSCHLRLPFLPYPGNEADRQEKQGQGRHPRGRARNDNDQNAQGAHENNADPVCDFLENAACRKLVAPRGSLFDHDHRNGARGDPVSTAWGGMHSSA